MNPFCFFFLPQRSNRGQSEGSCTELLLKVGQFNLRIYCLLTDFVTTCLILKKSRECLVFLRRFRFWDLFSTDINPDTHRKLHTHTHTHETSSPPLGEQPLDEPGIPVYQMCQLVIFLTLHLIGLCLKRGECNKTKTGGLGCQMVQ